MAPRSIVTLTTLGLCLAVASVASAKVPVAVLAFGGADGPAVRDTLISALERRYEVVDGQEVLDASDELGITMTRGRNLARAARHAGVVAVVGGAVSGGYLSLAVYSAKSGDVVNSGRVRCRGQLGRRSLRKALTIILKGFRRCPKRPTRRRRPKPVVPAPAAPPAPTPAPSKAPPSLTFDPDPVIRGDGGGASSGGTNTAFAGDPGETEENPLATPKGPAAGVGEAETPVTVKKPVEDTHGTPKVEATVGFGLWMRSLRINQPDTNFPAPKYDSGAAFSIGVGFKARPLAFFTGTSYLASLYSRLGYQTMLGLESRNKKKDPATGAEVEETFGTSLWELRWEIVGYDMKLLDGLDSPHIEGGFGFGLMNFAIDWGDATNRPMPDASYKFVLFSVGGYMPFYDMFGALLRFDYRVVTGTGEIEDDKWYGGSSTGGINVLLGGYATWKGIIARLEYGYTRYFYSFEEAEQRLEDCKASAANCKRAAGGALDVLHSIMVNVGYGY